LKIGIPGLEQVNLSSPPVFSVVRVARSLVFCVVFVDRCWSFCSFSFGHCCVCPSFGHCCVCPSSFGHCCVCPSSNYGFCLPLWYLQNSS